MFSLNLPGLTTGARRKKQFAFPILYGTPEAYKTVQALLGRPVLSIIRKPYKQKLVIGDMTKMTMGYKVFLNCTRNDILAKPPAVRKTAAMKEVKMFVVPKALRRVIFDIDKIIPDALVSEEMAERYFEISPPVFSLIIPDYQSIADEIEQSYVIGNDFSALSASCVVIERLLNKARIDLHKHHKVIKKLWGKGSQNDWPSNINALMEWGYLDKDFALELSAIYKHVRCEYLHSGEIKCLRNDALRTVTVAYKLMKIFIGFPEDLFDGVACKNEADPRYLAFYKPYLQDIELTEVSEKYAEIVKLKPDDYVVYNNWGSAISLWADRKGNEKLFEQACQKFEQAIQFVNVESEKYGVFHNWGCTLGLWARFKGDEKLFEQANQKFEQAANIKPNKPEVYDNWAGILIHWSKLKIGTSEYEGLLKQAEEKCLKAESLRKGFSAYRLARIYALSSDEKQCRKGLLTGQEAGTLPERDYAMKESDFYRVKNELWFKELKWKGEK